VEVLVRRTKSQRQPNIVIVYPDQMRGQAMGFLNEDPVVTPHLDRFAEESLVLTDAIAGVPLCSPSRAMLMTGMYPHATGVLENCHSQSAPYGCELSASACCWSDVLKDKGYSLGYIGKWHLDSPHEPYVSCKNNRPERSWNEWCPPERRHGFDYWYSYGTYDWHMNPMYWDTDAAREEFHFVHQWGPEHEADKAIDYIRNSGGQFRDPDKPFALVVAMNPPHPPYEMYPEAYATPYQGKDLTDLVVRPNVDIAGDSLPSRLARDHTMNYFAMITGVDAQFGRILAALDDQELTEDTIVLFTSDHGSCVGAHGFFGKWNPYEESVRVPFLIRWPGHITAQRDNLLLSVPDICPTLLDLCGYRDAIPGSVQGQSFARVFTGGDAPRPTSQPYYSIPYDNPAGGVRGVRCHDYKLVITASGEEGHGTALFDRTTDPYELDNLALSESALAREIAERELRPWLELTDDPWISTLDNWTPTEAFEPGSETLGF